MLANSLTCLGTDAAKAFAVQRKFQAHGPLVNSEYYTGWLDRWGIKHQTTDAITVANYLDKILAMNASVNMYMFEGGTNFGYMNGTFSSNMTYSTLWYAWLKHSTSSYSFIIDYFYFLFIVDWIYCFLF